MKPLEEYLQENLKKSTAKSYLYEIKKYQLINKNTPEYHYKNIME